MGSMAAYFVVISFGLLVPDACANDHYSWNSWASWSTCNVNCTRIDTHTYIQTRSRTCHDRCHHNVAESHCGTHFHETRACPNNCAINGGWGEWQKWSACTHTCGHATKTRLRSCDHPTPQHGGHECSGSVLDTDACKLDDCPVAVPTWTTWSEWTSCSATCDGGSAVRMRHCGSAQDICPGSPFEKTDCGTDACPATLTWSSWTEWGQCSASCGIGSTFRLRHCGTGQDICQGSPFETKSCETGACVTDGGWSDWSSWTACNIICGSGHNYRFRTCSNPTPAGAGADCTGVKHERRLCHTVNCPSEFMTCHDDDLSLMTQGHDDVIDATPTAPEACSTPEATQEMLLGKMCHVTSPVASWTLGVQLNDSCESVPLYSPFAIVNKKTSSRKYGIFFGCYRDIIQLVDLACRLKVQTYFLNDTSVAHHLLLM